MWLPVPCLAMLGGRLLSWPGLCVLCPWTTAGEMEREKEDAEGILHSWTVA